MGLDNATFTYQWIQNEDVMIVDITNATGSTYTLTDDDMGRLTSPYLMVRVSFTDDAGNFRVADQRSFWAGVSGAARGLS